MRSTQSVDFFEASMHRNFRYDDIQHYMCQQDRGQVTTVVVANCVFFFFFVVTLTPFVNSERKRKKWTKQKYEYVYTSTVYDGVYHTPLRRFSMLDISTVGIVSVPKKCRRWEHLAESFPKTYRSVLAPSWLSSNRAWETAGFR